MGTGPLTGSDAEAADAVAADAVAADAGAANRTVGIAVVIPTWDGAGLLPPCIRSLAAQTYPDVTVVVVDNGSVDNTSQVLDDLAAQIAPVPLRVIRNATNLGFAGGVNTGIRFALDAGFELIALFNNDAVADPDWLANLAGELTDRPRVGMVTCLFLLGDGALIDSTGDFYCNWGFAFPRDRGIPRAQAPSSGPVFGASGGATLYRAELFRRVGLFDEDFFAYYEDVDLSFRAQLSGWEVRYCRDAVAFHLQAETSGRIPGFGIKQTFRNLPLLLIKNVPGRLLLPIGARFVLLYALMLVNSVLKGQGRGALAGAGAAARLFFTVGLRGRRRVQASRIVDITHLRSVMWKGFPPVNTARKMRRLRQRLTEATIGRFKSN